MSKTKAEVVSEIQKRCSDDAAFRTEFLADPRTHLAQAGLNVPARIAITVTESTADTFAIALPPLALELDDDALDAVTGGSGRAEDWCHVM